jgi:hypothetical protein
MYQTTNSLKMVTRAGAGECHHKKNVASTKPSQESSRWNPVNARKYGERLETLNLHPGSILM